MTIKPAFLGEIVLRALHAEGFSITSTRVDAAPTPGSYAETFPEREPTKPMPTLPDPKPPGTASPPPPPRRTMSAAHRSLLAHYRRIVGEEGQAIAAVEEELHELRKDPKVVRYLEAAEALRVAIERRDRAAQDLGFAICKEGDIQP